MKNKKNGFTLIESMAAVLILGIIVSSVIVVFIRCSSGSLDSMRKMQVFEVARENMENTLAEDTVSEKSEYGFSEKYPDIEWATKIQTFYEPVHKKMWVKAVCSAQYEDSKGEIRTVEFSHWLTKLSDNQVKQVLKARDKLQELYDERFGEDFNEPSLEDFNEPFVEDFNL
ncbi:MAG: type II secretion system protein [Sedimentisphaerales bacterium]|nr:type II secretion system protein [Sedimentisphaerales bacterium]